MIYSVQYLRGLAALLVVTSHLLTKIEQLSGHKGEWFSIGQSGVDLFFIISGFIMCKATENKSIPPLSFIIARIRRIIPLYWLLSLVALAIFIFRPSLVNSSGGTTTILHSFTLIPVGEKLLIQNGWTLSFEFLFYGIFALALALNPRGKIQSSILFLCILIAAGLILSPISTGAKFITNALLLEFAMGMAAYLYLKKYSSCKILNFCMMLLGVASLCTFSGDTGTPYRVVYFGLPMLAIFIGFVSFESSIRNISNRKILWPLKALGDSSYSLYLFHPFALALAVVVIRSLHLQENIAVSACILISAAVTSGYMCYVGVERPLDKYFRPARAKDPVGNGARLGL